jgi:hypothetical protein
MAGVTTSIDLSAGLVPIQQSQPPIDLSAGLVPLPSSNQTLRIASSQPLPSSTPSTSQTSVGPEDSSSILQKAAGVINEAAKLPTDPLGLAGDALGAVSGQGLTQSGRASHPVAAWLQDKAQGLQEFLFGGKAAGKPMGTSGGVADEASILAAVPAAEETTELAVGKAGEAIEGMRAARAAKQAEAAAKAARSVAEVNPEQFIYREPGPAPQHGTPVKVATPLDNATINKLPGGKDLSPEAVRTLKTHIGGEPGKEIEVGSTPKNTLLKAVEPLQKTIADTGAKMQMLVENAPRFKTAINEDNFNASGDWSKRSIEKSIDDLRQNLPGGDEERLSKAVDKELESAQGVLDSRDANEVLEYRRKLGSQIDWNNIAKNPETPGEVQNATKVRIYSALSNKLHDEIPGMAELDKTFQPNLELQSHLDAKLGTTVSRNPTEANAQQASELAKGKRQIQTEAHNEIVAKNRRLAGLPESDVQPSIGAAGQKTPIDVASDKAIAKFNVSPADQGAIRRLLQPNVKAGRMFGTNTDWFGALKSFDELTPEQRAARFADPSGVRKVLVQQRKMQLAKALVKWGSVAALAHELGIDKAALRGVLGE